MNVKEEIKSKLEKYPHIKYQEEANSINIFPSDESGFTIMLEENHSNYSVYFEGWHESFENPEEALNCVAFGLSDSCRLKVTSKGDSPHKWAVESKENNQWVFDSETGMFIFPFWKKTKVVFKQNHLINET